MIRNEIFNNRNESKNENILAIAFFVITVKSINTFHHCNPMHSHIHVSQSHVWFLKFLDYQNFWKTCTNFVHFMWYNS